MCKKNKDYNKISFEEYFQSIKFELYKFYSPYFDTSDIAKEFVNNNWGGKDKNTRLMLYQTKDTVLLADNICKIKGSDSLRLFFLLVCAELISKLYYNYKAKKDSKKYTKLFFDCFLQANDKKLLDSSISTRNKQGQKRHLSLTYIVNFLYDVRCFVAHEGDYGRFNFCHEKECSTATKMPRGEGSIIVTISYEKFRDAVVRGTINAIKDYYDRSLVIPTR